MSSGIEDRIRAASARNRELLGALAATDHAVPDLEQQEAYVADLEGQVANAGRRLAEIDRRRQKELKEHASYRDSVLRRFAYKAAGRRGAFEARAAKEEREYFEVLQVEHREAEMRRTLEAMLDDARRVRAELEAAAARHAAARRELDGLYDAIFAGPTPGFADEDEREREGAAALRAYHEARTRAEAEGQAARALAAARAHMAQALAALQDALGSSRMDMFGAGGSLADVMERNALCRAETCALQAQRLAAQARTASPAVRALPPARIAQGSLMSDVFFDNIFTDMAFHQRIQQSDAEARHCMAALEAELAAAQARRAGLAAELAARERALEDARARLQRAREAAFERITGLQGPPRAEAPAPREVEVDEEKRPGGENWWE